MTFKDTGDSPCVSFSVILALIGPLAKAVIFRFFAFSALNKGNFPLAAACSMMEAYHNDS
ncbi:MAG: hypothetical protein ACKOEW_01520 [Methylocystis sp.]